MKILYSSFFIAFVTIVLLATGCKKDKQNPVLPPAISVIRQKMLPSGDELAIYNYLYNDDKTLQAVKKITPVNTSPAGNPYTEFNYEKKRVNQIVTKQANGTSTTQKFVYDGAGRIITSQIIPLIYHEMENGTFVPNDEIQYIYNFNYNSPGKISRIEEVTLKGRYADTESRYYYDYEYNSQKELVKLINYDPGDMSSGGTWIIDGYSGAVDFDPFAISPLNLTPINPFVLKQIGKLPTSMKFYFNDDINGTVREKKEFTYNLNNKKLDYINYTYSSFLFTPFTMHYGFDVLY